MTRKSWFGLRSENECKRYLDELSKSKGLHNLGGSNAVVRDTFGFCEALFPVPGLVYSFFFFTLSFSLFPLVMTVLINHKTGFILACVSLFVFALLLVVVPV